jgi:hypothetical protein
VNGVLGYLNVVHGCAEWEKMRGSACVADASKGFFAVVIVVGGTYVRAS